MLAVDRRSLILRCLEQRERVQVTELAGLCQTSEVTIRKDLDDLAASGAVRRVRGGAVGRHRRGITAPFGVREHQDRPEKERIAAAAADSIGDGEAVLLDAGTTGLLTALALQHREATVMPLSAREIAAFVDAPAITLVLPGGSLRPGELAAVGSEAERGITRLRFDTFLFTPCALSAEHGATAYDPGDAAIKRAGISVSSRVIALAEGRKLARTALAAVCPAADIDLLITDSDAPADQIEALTEAGIAVHRV